MYILKQMVRPIIPPLVSFTPNLKKLTRGFFLQNQIFMI